MLRSLANLAFPGSPAPELQRQPAGYDLTAASIARFTGQGALDLTNENRCLPYSVDLPWHGGTVLLKPGGYLVTYNEEIEVPLDSAGIVLPRSSLMRCGATLYTALWDPGYRGRGQGLLSVLHPLALHRDARIAQFVLLSLESAVELGYSGQYQFENVAG